MDYARFDGADSSENALKLAEMDSFRFLPAADDEVLVGFEFGELNHHVEQRVVFWDKAQELRRFDDGLPLIHDHGLDAAIARTNKPSLTVKFDIGGAPDAPEPDHFAGGPDDDASKPGLVVKLDIGGPIGALE